LGLIDCDDDEIRKGKGEKEEDRESEQIEKESDLLVVA
jgi:hypothetical protein